MPLLRVPLLAIERVCCLVDQGPTSQTQAGLQNNQGGVLGGFQESQEGQVGLELYGVRMGFDSHEVY